MTDGAGGRHAATGHHTFVRDETALSTVGVVLLVAVSVVSAAAPVAYVKMTGGFGAPAVTAYDVDLAAGPDKAWGTGDESVVVQHRAGQQLMAREVQVLIQTTAGDTVLEGPDLGMPLEEPFAGPGTDWTYTLPLEQGADVHVEIVLQRALQEILVTRDDLTAGSDLYGGLATTPAGGGQGDGEGEGEGQGDGEGDGGGEGEDEGEDGHTLCHFPPGNPDGAHTITVGSQGAVNAHLSHGDHLGACADDD